MSEYTVCWSVVFVRMIAGMLQAPVGHHSLHPWGLAIGLRGFLGVSKSGGLSPHTSYLWCNIARHAIHGRRSVAAA